MGKLIHADDWLVDLETWSQQDISLKWLIKNWVRQDAIMRLSGPMDATYKLAIDFAMTIATDKKTWNGHPTQTGRVVLLMTPPKKPLNYIANWMENSSASSSQISISKRFDFENQADFDEFKEELKEMPDPPCLILLDASFWCETGSMKLFIHKLYELMREIKCSVLFIDTDYYEISKGARINFQSSVDIDMRVKTTSVKKSKMSFTLKQTKNRDSKQAEDKNLFMLNDVPVSMPEWLCEIIESRLS